MLVYLMLHSLNNNKYKDRYTMGKLITDTSYKPRDKKAEKAKGINRGGFIDLTKPKTAKGK